MREAPSVAERPLSQTGKNVEEHFQNLNIFVQELVVKTLLHSLVKKYSFEKILHSKKMIPLNKYCSLHK